MILIRIVVLTLSTNINQQQFALIAIILYTSSVYAVTIVQYTFIKDIFKPQLFSSHAVCLLTKLTELFLNWHCLLYFAFYMVLRRTSMVLRCPCSIGVACLLVYSLFILMLLPVYFFFSVFSFIVMLLLYSSFFVNNVKSPLYFCFWNFCLSF